MTYYKLNTKYKDRLFRLIFHEKKELLELYNAVNESNYTNPEELEITTIEDVVYMGMKNDLSFIIGDEMNLYEHQSSFCPNLPLRGLFYFSSVYKSYIEPVKRRLYSTSRLEIPFPQYIVFYNGMEKRPEREELKLSKLFIGNGKGKQPSLECTALILNVNYGHNKELMERCRTLKEYAQFIAAIRRVLKPGMKEEEAQKAVEQVVEECIRGNVLANILRKNRSEIVDSILTEWDEDDFIEGVKEEAEERGKVAGEIKGKVEMCQEFHVSKEDTLARIIKDFSLEELEAKKYMDEYWK